VPCDVDSRHPDLLEAARLAAERRNMASAVAPQRRTQRLARTERSHQSAEADRDWPVELRCHLRPDAGRGRARQHCRPTSHYGGSCPRKIDVAT